MITARRDTISSSPTNSKLNNLYQKMQQEESIYYRSLNLGGTIRKKTIEETKADLYPLFEKIGITRIADIGGLDKIGIPVSTAIRPNAKHLCGAQGKGLTKDLAHVSAIMEAIESFHMEHPPKPEFLGSYNSLNQLYPLINPKLFPSGKIAKEDLQDQNISWNIAFDLNKKGNVYVPHALINLDSSKLNPDSGLFSVTTNGLAGGNTINEAISHALYEVIERDAVWRWLKKPRLERDKTKLNLKTINSENNQYLLEKFALANVNIEVWETPSIITIPAYYCTIYDATTLNAGGVFYGSGCHLIPEIALSRAITEAAQSRATFISGSRDDIYPRLYEKQHLQQIKLLETCLKEKTFPGVKSFENKSAIEHSPNMLQNIENMIAALDKSGCSHILVFDHTQPTLNIPVVQVLIPTLKNFSSETKA